MLDGSNGREYRNLFWKCLQYGLDVKEYQQIIVQKKDANEARLFNLYFIGAGQAQAFALLIPYFSDANK
ncbi:hypothetical protein BZG02_04965 [Labilibaculum filiforme]|uniref:Uncharacterized protein n=1 Tax=Labilibaculum filiforme TaxID=1940526 RepID=A0A2N3I1I2_9BACT|nr:hypothetical protein [Labilibaculum filiforme]PKQ64179.1 hypothetical protein BZG02_04965 [Labilibaculum filiforme]